MKRVFVLFVLTLGLVLPAQTASVGFPASRDGVVQFVTPALDKGCTFIPFDGAGGIVTNAPKGELHCYRLHQKFDAVSLGTLGKALKLRVEGKLKCCGRKNVLAYGQTWAADGFKCTALRDQLKCSFKGHGFSIKQSAIARY